MTTLVMKCDDAIQTVVFARAPGFVGHNEAVMRLTTVHAASSARSVAMATTTHSRCGYLGVRRQRQGLATCYSAYHQ